MKQRVVGRIPGGSWRKSAPRSRIWPFRLFRPGRAFPPPLLRTASPAPLHRIYKGYLVRWSLQFRMTEEGINNCQVVGSIGKIQYLLHVRFTIPVLLPHFPRTHSQSPRPRTSVYPPLSPSLDVAPYRRGRPVLKELTYEYINHFKCKLLKV